MVVARCARSAWTPRREPKLTGCSRRQPRGQEFTRYLAGKFAPVPFVGITVACPVRSLEAAIRTISACACGLHSVFACSIPGRARSSVVSASPVALASPLPHPIRPLDDLEVAPGGVGSIRIACGQRSDCRKGVDPTSRGAASRP